jgi:hypothetical protein
MKNQKSGCGSDEKRWYDVAVGCSLTALGKMASRAEKARLGKKLPGPECTGKKRL